MATEESAAPVVSAESADAALPDGSPPQATEEQKAAEVAAKKFKLKFGKQEREVDENELVAIAQKGWAAEEKFQQAAQTRKQVEQAQQELRGLLQRLREDPDTVLRQLGVENPTELYKQRLSEHIKRELMTPEQKELLAAKERLSAYEKQEQLRKQQEQQAQLQRLEEQYKAQYDKEFSEAMKSTGLPKTPRTVSRMADLMYKKMAEEQRTGESIDITPRQIAEMVREEYINDVKDILGGYGDDKLLDLLGNDNLKKIQTLDAKRRKSATNVSQPVRQVAKPGDGKRIDGDGRQIVSRDEWREHLEKWMNS